MIDKNKQEEQGSMKDVSDKWLDLIFNSLKLLEYYEREFKSGCQGIQDFIQQLGYANPYGILAMSQVKAMELLVNEFDITLTNIEPIISKNKYEEMRKKLLYCMELQSSKYGVLYEYTWGCTDKFHGKPYTNGIKFHLLFFTFIQKTAELRGDIIRELSPVLFIKQLGKQKQKQT